jgi:hypothetical protein
MKSSETLHDSCVPHRRVAILPQTIKEGVEMPEYRMTVAPHVVSYADEDDQHDARRVKRVLQPNGCAARRAFWISIRKQVTFFECQVPSYYLNQRAQEIARAVP